MSLCPRPIVDAATTAVHGQPEDGDTSDDQGAGPPGTLGDELGHRGAHRGSGDDDPDQSRNPTPRIESVLLDRYPVLRELINCSPQKAGHGEGYRGLRLVVVTRDQAEDRARHYTDQEQHAYQSV